MSATMQSASRVLDDVEQLMSRRQQQQSEQEGGGGGKAVAGGVGCFIVTGA